MRKHTGTLAAVLGILLLSACGGGDEPASSNSGLPASEVEQVRSDPRVIRLGGVMERADTLLIPSSHTWYSITVQGETISRRAEESVSCNGPRCVGNSSREAVSLDDFVGPSSDTDVIVTKADLGSQAGFDTLTFSGSSPVSIPDLTITSEMSADYYGAWGQFGAAYLIVTDLPVSGRYQGIPFTGDFRGVVPYVAGDTAETNPTGLGSATWTGVAEAASTRNFRRRQGQATLTIAELSRPRVGVEIDIAGYAIGSPGWSDIPLANGGFKTGHVGSDFLEGNFHGSDHGEAYGVFDTGPYVGAFGAKRTQ